MSIMGKSKKSCLILVGTFVIYMANAIAAYEHDSKEDGKTTKAAMYTFSNIGISLGCLIKNDCQTDAAEEILTLLRDAMEPMCDEDRPYSESIGIVLNAGLIAMHAIAEKHPTCVLEQSKASRKKKKSSSKYPECIRGHFKKSKSKSRSSSKHKGKGKCKVDNDLTTILKKFPDLYSLVSCHRSSVQPEVEEIVVGALELAVCKKYSMAVSDLAAAAANIDEKLRMFGDIICKRVSQLRCKNKG